MKAQIDVEYVIGHLRYGYYEFNIPDNKIEEWYEYINLLKSDVLSEEADLRLDELSDEFSEYRKLIVTDYSIEDIGPMIINSYSIKFDK